METLTLQQFLDGTATLGACIALLSAALTPLIAILAVVIMMQQRKISRESLKEAMLDRRLSVLGAVLDANLAAGFGNIGDEDYGKFLAGTGLADILGFEKHVLDYIKKVDKKFKEAMLLQRLGDHRTPEQDKEYDKLQRWFQAQVIAAKVVFEGDLRVSF